MVCCRYIVVNTLHTGDSKFDYDDNDDDDDDDDNNNNNKITTTTIIIIIITAEPTSVNRQNHL